MTSNKHIYSLLNKITLYPKLQITSRRITQSSKMTTKKKTKNDNTEAKENLENLHQKIYKQS